MIHSLNNKSVSVAEKLFSIWQESYIIEAKLLKVNGFPPLNRTMQDFLNSSTHFYGFVKNDVYNAVIEIRDKDGVLHIQSLVVQPSQFRKGLASKMIAFVLSENMECKFTVETGCDNLPAINLYLKFGFVETKQYETDHGIRKICLLLNRNGN